jgi:hypothetical protein|tara:strand:- start:381 stop:554 length:174 start_codon:yes stop_codon:yes gene_type:complete
MGCGCKNKKNGKAQQGNCKGGDCDKKNNVLNTTQQEQRDRRTQIIKDKLKGLAKHNK